MIAAFRQEDCIEDSLLVRPDFLQDGRTYLLTDEDTAETLVKTGAELRNDGLCLEAGEPKSSVIWHIRPAE